MSDFALLLSFCFLTATGAEKCVDAREVYPVEAQCLMMIPRRLTEGGVKLASMGAMITNFTVRCVAAPGSTDEES